MFLRLTKLSTTFSLLLVMSAGLSGCAFKRIIFDRLDWVVMYQIDDYLDLDKTQKAKIKPVVGDAVSWIKKEKVPAAIDTLEKLELAARRKSYDENVNKTFTAQVDSIRAELATRYEGQIIDLLMSLSEDQIKHLAKRSAKMNKEIEEVLEDKDVSQYDDFLKRQRKTLTEYYGELSDEQEKTFLATMRLTREQIERRLNERKRVQSFIQDTLRSKDRTKIGTMVRNFRDHGEVWQDKSYREYRSFSEKRWENFLLIFHKSLSDEQWKHLEKKLRETRKDLGQMIGREES